MQATLNATSVVQYLAHAVLYGPEMYLSTNITTSLSELSTGPVRECKDGKTKCILEWYVCKRNI